VDGHAVAKVVLLEPGGGLELPMGVGADRITFKATGEDTGGMLTFLEYWGEPGSRGTTVHIHDGHEEGFYVIEGTLDMQVGDEKHKVAAGGYAFVPRGVAHAFWNDSREPCRFVATFSPPGFERFFIELAEMMATGTTRNDRAFMDEFSRRHGMTVVGPSPAPRTR
jgi:quercetin dioxygenase-like cupin family protein